MLTASVIWKSANGADPFGWNDLLAFWSPVVTSFASIAVVAFPTFRTIGLQDRKTTRDGCAALAIPHAFSPLS
jgi:hypothetical protein